VIHIFIGTKAQLIKMAPIMIELDQRGIVYNYLDSGQHAELSQNLRTQFGLREPDYYLREDGKNIVTFFQAFQWMLSTFWKIIFNQKKIYSEIFKGQKGVCLIHGDTLTTLFSLLYAKRCGLQVGHVEAGLRSYKLWDPFPEEIIRLIVMRFSDILFAPSEWAVSNMERMGYKDKAIFICGNTIIDAIRFAQDQDTKFEIPDRPYILVTIHRVETIYSKVRLSIIITLLEKLSHDKFVYFVMHEPTKRQIDRFGFMPQLEKNDHIQLISLRPYLEFVKLIEKADFIITDGGSIQEESNFLNKPCLIMRSKTERLEGIGKNALLSEFDPDKISTFVNNWQNYSSDNHNNIVQPSKIIVDHLVELDVAGA